MKFDRMESPFPEQAMWGARAGPYSFIITHDEAGYSASARDHLTDGAQTEHLGQGYGACREFWRAHRN